MKKYLALILLLPAFYTGNAQNVGIGTDYTLAPLGFGPAYGNKIVFWGSPFSTNYGIGTQPGQLQVYVNTPSDYIGFGLGRSATFAENLKITGDGRVGVYAQNPVQVLDIGGRIRLTAIDTFYYNKLLNADIPGFAPSSMFFNNIGNTAISAKLGPSDSLDEGIPTYTFYGFHQYSTNKLRLGVSQKYAGAGRLAINGSVGDSGQVLRSRGPNGAANWTNMPGPDMYANSKIGYGELFGLTNSLKLYSQNTVSYSLQAPAKLLVRFRVSANAVQCDFCGPSVFDIVIADNGSVVRTFRFTISNGLQDSDKTASALLTMPAGNHFFTLGGYMVSGPAVEIGRKRSPLSDPYGQGDGQRLLVQFIPSYN